MNRFLGIGIALLVGLVLSGCGKDAVNDPDGPGDAEMSSYDRTWVPTYEPAGFTAVRAQSYADHDLSGQSLRFSFGADTLYSCLRPEGETVSAVGVSSDRQDEVVNCPQEGKRILKVVERGGIETVFSVDEDPVEGKGSTSPVRNSDITDFVQADELEANPEWLASAINQSGG